MFMEVSLLLVTAQLQKSDKMGLKSLVEMFALNPSAKADGNG
jgi:hypothetical protein